MADSEETAWMPSGFRLSIASSVTRKDEQLGFATAREMFKRCVCCACVYEEGVVTGFCKGRSCEGKGGRSSGEKRKLASAKQTFKSPEFSLYHYSKNPFPPSTLACFLLKLRSFTPRTPHKEELVLEPRTLNRFNYV